MRESIDPRTEYETLTIKDGVRTITNSTEIELDVFHPDKKLHQVVYFWDGHDRVSRSNQDGRDYFRPLYVYYSEDVLDQVIDMMKRIFPDAEHHCLFAEPRDSNLCSVFAINTESKDD
jgi:hypothetical protein